MLSGDRGCGPGGAGCGGELRFRGGTLGSLSGERGPALKGCRWSGAHGQPLSNSLGSLPGAGVVNTPRFGCRRCGRRCCGRAPGGACGVGRARWATPGGDAGMDRDVLGGGQQGSTGQVAQAGTRSRAGRGSDGVDLPGGRMVTSATWSGEALALPRSGCSGDHAAVAHSHSEVMPVARRDRRPSGGCPRPATSSPSKAVSVAGVCRLVQRERKATCTALGALKQRTSELRRTDSGGS